MSGTSSLLSVDDHLTHWNVNPRDLSEIGEASLAARDFWAIVSILGDLGV